METAKLTTEERSAISMMGLLDWHRNPSIKKEFESSQAYCKYLFNMRLRGESLPLDSEPQSIHETRGRPSPYLTKEQESAFIQHAKNWHASNRAESVSKQNDPRASETPASNSPNNEGQQAFQIIRKWKNDAAIRAEFGTYACYEAWTRCKDRAKEYKPMGHESWDLETWEKASSQPAS